MSSSKFDVEKFDGRINFGLWQVQVKDILIQAGLHKVLKGKPVPISNKDAGKGIEIGDERTTTSADKTKEDEDWEDLDLRAASLIRLCLAKNVLANIHGISSAKELWEKLEELYQTKSLSNRLYLKEQFHSLRMDVGTKISDHLSVLNGIVSELEAIGVQVDDEDKALRLIWSLPSSYEHIKPILMYGKDTVSFAEVTSKLISEERRLNGGNAIPAENSVLVAANWKKNNSKKKQLVCWGCGQSGHLKRNCPKSRAGSANNDTDGDANSASLLAGDSDFL